MTPRPIARQYGSLDPRLAQWLLSAAVLLAGLAITFLQWRAAGQHQTAALRTGFELETAQVARNLDSRLSFYAILVRGVQGYVHGSEEVTRDEFRSYVAGLQDGNPIPGVQGVGLVRLVSHADSARFLAAVRRQYPGFRIIPDGARTLYAPIVYMEPMTPDNRRAIGFDTLTQPTTRTALEQALASNDMAISARMVLAQDAHLAAPSAAFVMYLPVYRKGASLATPAERRAAAVGWVDVPVRMDDLMAGLRGEFNPDIDLEIHDGAPGGATTLMYRSPRGAHDARAPQGRLQSERRIAFGGRYWTLRMRSTPAFEERFGAHHQPWLVALSGLAMTLTVSALIWFLLSRRESERRRFRQMFNQASDGILVLDRRHRCVDANASAAQMFGHARAELLQLRLPALLVEHEFRRLGFEAGGMPARTLSADEWVCRHKDGTSFPAEATVRRLDFQHYFVVLRDLTERRKAELQLRDSEARYRLFFSANPVPMWVYDLETLAFLAVNDAAISQYGYAREEFLGMTVADIRPPEDLAHLREQVRADAARPDHYVDAGRWRHKRKDGSLIWVEITGHRLEYQGRAAEIILAQDVTARVEAEEQLRLGARVFESSHEGLMVTDAATTIVSVNRALTAMSGYAAHELVGSKPSLLKSGRQDAEFYRGLWEALARNHHWQGEVWNRRKDGEIYPVWLGITELRDDAGKVTHYIASVADMSRYKAAEETIHNLANFDMLTGLPNRRVLMERLAGLVQPADERQGAGAILYIDLDDFKSLNDTRGHDVGDLLLVEVSRRILGCVHPDDVVARLGSDEFVVALTALDSNPLSAARRAERIAERIHQAIRQPMDLRGEDYHCKSSIGMTLFHDREATADELLRKADAAMFQAKRSGRDRIHFFDAEMQAALERRVVLEAQLRKAIPHQLLPYYQIQVDREGRAIGAELLLRWQHPEQGMVSPATFIPLAEESGLILPIGRWVLEQACRQLKAWEANPATRHLLIAVNVSAKQFHHPEFVAQVLAALDGSAADPTRLKLELTESLLIENVEAIIAKMEQLKARGVCFSLDDFGTGFSSLAYLKRLPLDQLKIDQAFVRDILTDPNDAAIVRTIIALGQSLGLNVIAEGVETEEQKSFLAVNGCFSYQGYLFGRPAAIEAFERELLARAVPVT